jgi:putative transposase
MQNEAAPPTGRRLQRIGRCQPMSRYPRVPPRLDCIFRNNPVYFATFCTYKRRAILANGTVDGAFREFTMRAYTEHNIALGRYVIMPEHIHLFVCGPDDFSLGAWIGSLKQALAKSMGRSRGPHAIWQRGFFDHLLRSDESYGQKWNYVRENPVRAGLVGKAEDWPYADEIIIIDRT